MSKKDKKPEIDDEIDRDIDDMFGDTIKEEKSINPMLKSNSSPNVGVDGEDGPQSLRKSSSQKQQFKRKFSVDSDDRSVTGQTKSQSFDAEKGSKPFPKKNNSDSENQSHMQVIRSNMRAKVSQTKDSIISGAKYVRQLDMKQVKDKYEEADKFWSKSKSLLKQSGAILQNQEPEIKRTPYWGWFKYLVTLLIFILVIIYVVNTNLSLIGTEKTQEVTILKKNELLYNIQGGIYTLMPLHFFTTMNRNKLIDRMECLVQGNKKQCDAYEFRKCETVGIKVPEYDECMIIAYGMAGLPLRSFCDKHYNETSTTVWSKSETVSNGYLDQKYQCLKNAGVPKGLTYCEDLQRISSVSSQNSKMQLYDCYISSGVSNDTFADDRCSYLHDKNSYDESIRQEYIRCMNESGQSVGDNPKFVCNNKFPWQKDNAFIQKCNSSFYSSFVDNLVIPNSEQTNLFSSLIPIDIIPPIVIPPIDTSIFGGLRRRMQFGFATPTTTTTSTTNDDTTASPFGIPAIDTTAFDIPAIEIPVIEIPTIDIPGIDTSDLNQDFGLDAFTSLDLESFDLSGFVTDFNPMGFFESVYQTWASFGAFNYIYLGYTPTQKQYDDIAYLEQALAKATADYNAALEAEKEEPVVEEPEEEEKKSLDPFAAFVELVVDAFNGTEDATVDGGAEQDPFAAITELLKPPSLEDFFVPIDLTFDVDIGFKAPEISNWTNNLYGNPSASSCSNYFQNGMDLAQCYQSDVSVYDYETCNTRTWNQWYRNSIDAKTPNITPPASEYFKCYFEELPMTKEPIYAAQHKEACQSLYTDQRELLKCYEYMSIPYGFEDEMKICTNRYKFQSQIEKLYVCLEEFNMEKNIDYCNIHPDFSIIDFDLPDTLHLNFMTLSKKPFFECIAEVDESKAEKSDSRQCTADLYLFEKVEEIFTADGILDPSSFGIPAVDFNQLSSFDPASLDPTAAQSSDTAPTSSFPQPDYKSITDCLFFYKMPPSAVQEQICRWKHIPDKGAYESTLIGCTDKYNTQCFPKFFLQVFSNDDCNAKYDEDYQFLTGGEEQFLEDFGIQCKKVVINYAPFNVCMKKVDRGSTMAQMNSWKKTHLEEKGLAYVPYTSIDNDTLADYCNIMFTENKDMNDYVECMKYINQPLGAKECLILPENQRFVEKEYLFPYYQKYICLTYKETIIDDEARKCIYNGNIFLYTGLDMEFVTINECLKNYETEEGFKMNLRDIGKTSIYERVEGAPDYVAEVVDDGDFSAEDIVKDLPTTLTEEQILEFLCNDDEKRMSLNFTTIPFQKIEDYKKKKFNSMNFGMACETFTQFNGTHNNTVIHFSFPAENQKRSLQDSGYDGNFNESFLTIKRTDTNEQFFNLTMNQDLNFLQVQNHFLYFYDSADQVSLKNGEEFAMFQAHSNTTTIMETNAMIIFDQVAKKVNVKATPMKVIEIGKVIVRKILGIGIQYSDVTAKKIEFEKVDDLVAVEQRQSLTRKVLKAQQNSLIVNLKLGFGEQTVEYKFFTFGDIVGKIGGLWATYKSLIAYFAVFYIVRYAVNFASMAKRKDQQQIRLIEIAQYMKHIDSIKESLQDLILIQTGKVKKALKDDVNRIDEAIELETDLYDTTIEKHEVLKSMVIKYYPEGINDLFCIDQCTDEWERLQVYDTEKKHAYLTSKVGFSWGQMIDDMQFRMSIYGIYRMKDQAEIEKIRVEQTKEQLSNANDRIKKLEEKIK